MVEEKSQDGEFRIYLLPYIFAYTVNSEKPCGKIEVPDDLEEEEERQPTLVTRSLPRRCLSVEGATNNRSGMNQTTRPASVFLEMDNPRRFPTSTRSRRPRNYYISINLKAYNNLLKKCPGIPELSFSYSIFNAFLSHLKKLTIFFSLIKI